MDICTSNIPLESADDPPPPPYEHPQIDFHRGWRDRGFAIAFWIQAMIIIITGLVFGIWFLLPSPQHDTPHQKLPFNISHYQTYDLKLSFKISFTDPNSLILYSIIAAILIAILFSIISIFLLEKFATFIIINALMIIIAMELILATFLLIMVHWSASAVPFFLLIITIIFVCRIQKRIPFTASHLQVSCSILRAHPSLIFMAIVIRIIQVLWLILWSLMIIGIVYLCFHSSARNLNSNEIETTTTLPSYTVENQDRSNSLLYYTSLFFAFLFLIPAYWGTITFGNMVHFIIACTVGRWWFSGNTAEQYRMGKSIKRALTTNFGTICFGSLVEAILKALRTMTEDKDRHSFVAGCVSCLFECIEQIIGYMNEWGLIFASLTGQSFLEASRSFINLFKQRGWTIIINDTIVGYSLAIVNFFVGLFSALIAALIFYTCNSRALDQFYTYLILVSVIGFLLGVIINGIFTMVLTSCVRTIFICFAFNPAALGATHPDQLKRLSKVWHEVYPKEYASSNYDQYVPLMNSKDIA